MKPHVHAEMIKAWADGYAIEAYRPEWGDWIDTPYPSWLENVEYRAKPGTMERPSAPSFSMYVVGDSPDLLNPEILIVDNHQEPKHCNLRLIFRDDELIQSFVLVGGEEVDSIDEDSPW